jgi:GT2 family glycosyltransferase
MVSIVILTHNRKETLRKSLASILALDWPELEVIVVDNMSSDGTPEMVAMEFGPRVQLIRRTVDSPTAGRNQGFQAATGELILSIDNDMVFSDRDAIRKAVALFEEFPEVAIISFKIASEENPAQPLREHWWHPLPYETNLDRFFYTDYFSEGAVFLRARVVRELGGYDDEYFGGFEGVDLALRVLGSGHRIIYCPAIRCVELQISRYIERTRSEWNYYFLRNKLWTAWKNFPVARGIWFIGPRLMRDAMYSLRYGWFDLWFAALLRGLVPPASIRQKRMPIAANTWSYIRQVRTGAFGRRKARVCKAVFHDLVRPNSWP